MSQQPNDLHLIPESVANIPVPSQPDRTNATQYVLNVSLTFGSRGDAELAETRLNTTVFDGLVTSWSQVEALSW